MLELEFGKNGKSTYQCKCGVVFEAKRCNVKSGNTKSCGCLRKSIVGSLKRTHGYSGTKTYNSYNAMRSRCLNKKDKRYDNYGGRGISICVYWLESFDNFFADMGERPEGMTLDRIDVNGNYCKENCRWADAETQGGNKGIKKNSKTGISGVNFHKLTGKYSARVTINGTRHYIGVFDTIEEAAKSIDKFKEK